MNRKRKLKKFMHYRSNSYVEITNKGVSELRICGYSHGF